MSSAAAKKSTRVFLKNFDRLIKKRKMPVYDILPGPMYILGQEFDKFLMFKSLATAEDDAIVASKNAEYVADSRLRLNHAVRKYLTTDPEESGLMRITRKTLAARAREPSEELSTKEYSAAVKQEKERVEKYDSQIKILTKVFQTFNQYYDFTGSFVREESYRRIGDSDDDGF